MLITDILTDCLIRFRQNDFLNKKFYLVISCKHFLNYYWWDSNFIPRDSKKFESSNFDWAIRIRIENSKKIGNIRSQTFEILQL